MQTLRSLQTAASTQKWLLSTITAMLETLYAKQSRAKCRYMFNKVHARWYQGCSPLEQSGNCKLVPGLFYPENESQFHASVWARWAVSMCALPNVVRHNYIYLDTTYNWRKYTIPLFLRLGTQKEHSHRGPWLPKTLKSAADEPSLFTTVQQVWELWEQFFGFLEHFWSTSTTAAKPPSKAVVSC